MHIIKQHIFHLLAVYKGEVPLSIFLKAYFKNHSRLGSRDRKAISEALYGFYRLSRFFPEKPAYELIPAGIAAGRIRHPFLNHLFETALTSLDKNRVTDMVNTAIEHFETLFPLSLDLQEKEWAETLLQQRALFIRIRQNEADIKARLNEAGFAFKTIPSVEPEEAPDIAGRNQDLLKENSDTPQKKNLAQTCLALPNNLPLDKWLMPEDYVIQDYAVQLAVLKTAAYCRQVFRNAPLSIWDACAGAGGKALYWNDLFPDDRILATDRRTSILHNLRERAGLYNRKNIRTRVLDLNRTEQAGSVKEQFDLILCDVPCSGSGTWGRTPEQFHFADRRAIQAFPELQYRIVSRALSSLRPGGLLVYITCSAFKIENEALTEKITTSMPVQLVHQELIRNADIRSDIIYLALFRKDVPVKSC